MSTSKEKRFLKKLEDKKRFEKAFELHANIGVSEVQYRILDKHGNDVTKERINAVPN